MISASSSWVFALLLVGCDEPEAVWVPFNLEGQLIEVRVAPDDVCLTAEEPDPLVLKSSLDKREVGSTVSTPWCGPVGTEHEIVAEVFDDWQDLVMRVTIEVEPEAVSDLDGDGTDDSRGVLEYELRQDSADPGLWGITLQSLGENDEERIDTFGIVLWQPEELGTTTVAETTSE